jgi:class 3 adenylate cyclase
MAEGELSEFLARHPWPEPMLAGHRPPLEFLWRFEIEASVEAMWPLLSDTSRFNRALGLSEMHFEERDGQLCGSSVNGGLRHAWIEVPWQWVYGQHQIAVRDYSKGFGRYVRGIYEITEVSPTRFVLWVYFGWIPRNVVGGWVLKLALPSLEHDYRRVLDGLASAAREAQISPLYQVALLALAPPEAVQLAGKVTELLAADQPPALVERLAQHLRCSDELELARIQPKRLAREWAVEPRALLKLMLHATRVGLLDLAWDIVCPHCRGTRETHASLSRIPGESRCEVCEIGFDTRAEVSVEVTFKVNPAVRKVTERKWCAAEPALRPHILVNLRLEPGERRRITLGLDEGRYRLRCRGDQDHATLELRGDGQVSDEPLVWTPGLRASAALPASNASFELHNDSALARDFILERAGWSEDALRPGDLLSLAEFRDLFSEDYLAADVQLVVGMQTLLFTDMVGSTSFYASRGDAEAFVQVRQHFAEIFEVVAAHDGVVVKTIGDAVMAAFADAASAVRAAHAIQLRFPASREDLEIRVRISMNRGSCIAVRFNTDIDYFGNAVNLAAKLQGSAGAGQVAFSRTVHEAPGVVEALAELGVELEVLSASLPALGGDIEVLRWTAADGVDPSHSLAIPASAISRR